MTRAGVDGGAESTRARGVGGDAESMCARGACGTAVADGVAGAQPRARGELLVKSERSAVGPKQQASKSTSCAAASRVETKPTPRNVACRATFRPSRERRIANRSAGLKSTSETCVTLRGLEGSQNLSARWPAIQYV
eukprot:5545232-Pleurochrysis_carterae.AAC.1